MARERIANRHGKEDWRDIGPASSLHFCPPGVKMLGDPDDVYSERGHYFSVKGHFPHMATPDQAEIEIGFGTSPLTSK